MWNECRIRNSGKIFIESKGYGCNIREVGGRVRMLKCQLRKRKHILKLDKGIEM